jgi:hypothetical protein
MTAGKTYFPRQPVRGSEGGSIIRVDVPTSILNGFILDQMKKIRRHTRKGTKTRAISCAN